MTPGGFSGGVLMPEACRVTFSLEVDLGTPMLLLQPAIVVIFSFLPCLDEPLMQWATHVLSHVAGLSACPC